MPLLVILIYMFLWSSVYCFKRNVIIYAWITRPFLWQGLLTPGLIVEKIMSLVTVVLSIAKRLSWQYCSVYLAVFQLWWWEEHINCNECRECLIKWDWPSSICFKCQPWFRHGTVLEGGGLAIQGIKEECWTWRRLLLIIAFTILILVSLSFSALTQRRV